MTMTVNLGDALERSVEDMVANGRYGSRSEVLREGVRLVQERESRFEVYRSEVALGVEAALRGELVDAEEVFTGLDARYADAAAEDLKAPSRT